MKMALRIEGMSCGHCVRAVEHALQGVPGVQVVSVEVGRAVVTSPEPVNDAQLREAIEQAGFDLA